MTTASKRYSENIVAWNHLNVELFFATEILRLRSLHYGYWDDVDVEARFDLEDIRQAQARLTQRTFEHIPPGVKTILDVGAGIGDNARELSRRGFQVTSISPDRNHRRYFDAMKDPNITFRQCYFEDFEADEPFDMVFFGESLNYFDRRVGLEKCQKYVKPNGYILVSGMFRYFDGFPENFEYDDLDYIKMARGHGFKVLHLVDITKNCLPTMKIVHRAWKKFVEPAANFGKNYLESGSTWDRLVNSLFEKPRQRLSRVYQYYSLRTDPNYFLKHIRYVILLLQNTKVS